MRCPINFQTSISVVERSEVPGHLRRIGSKIRIENGFKKGGSEVVDRVQGTRRNRLRQNIIAEVGGLDEASNSSRVVSAASLSSFSSASSLPMEDYFSQEFVYWSIVLIAVMIALSLRKLFGTIVAVRGRAKVEQKLEIAVTKEMRYSNYEIVSPDTSTVETLAGTRRRTRSIPDNKKKISTSTNTFLLFSPVKSAGDE